MADADVARTPTMSAMSFDFSYRPLTYWPTQVSADGDLYGTGEAKARVIARLSMDGYMSGSNINLAAQNVGQSRIVYSIYDDEPDCELKYTFSPVESQHPLTMGEVITLLESTICTDSVPEYGLVIKGQLQYNTDCEVEDIPSFIRVTSAYYSQLQTYFAERIPEWLVECEKSKKQNYMHDEMMESIKSLPHLRVVRSDDEVMGFMKSLTDLPKR